MSLDSFKSETASSGGEIEVNDDNGADVNVADISWHISLDGYWDDVDERFFGEGTPNDPPLMNVPEKLAADMEYINDSEYATEVAELLDMESPDNYKSVIRVTFNDFSTWHWPLTSEDREFTSQIEHFIDRYIPEIIQWDAIIRGDDPNEALKEWKDDDEDPDFSWMDDMSSTEMSMKDIKWFNKNASWLPQQRKVVESSNNSFGDDSESGDAWMDDW